jgi:hypothetical protein
VVRSGILKKDFFVYEILLIYISTYLPQKRKKSLDETKDLKNTNDEKNIFWN